MRIAIAAEHFDPSGGGAERSTDQIARELAARGHEVTILSGYGVESDDDSGVRVRLCPGGKPRTALGLVRFSAWVERALREGKFDASLSITTAAAADVVQPRSGMVREFQLRNVARRRSAAGRVVKRAALMASPKQRALRVLEARTMRCGRVRRFVAISDYVRRQMMTHYGVAEDRIVVIPNAVELPEWTDSEKSALRGRLRREMEIGEGTTAFLFVSHNPALKGFGSLMAAFGGLVERGADVALLVVGCWSYRLERHAQRAMVRERVRFVGKTGEVGPLYCAADVCVLPSYFDPSSKVVLEALAMGLPAITSRYNGASDQVMPCDGVPRGRVVDEPDDVEALARAMAELTAPDERRRCAAAAAGLGEELSMRRHVDGLEGVLGDCRLPIADCQVPSVECRVSSGMGGA